MNGSEENAQESLRNVSKLGLHSARKLARAGIKVSMIELKEVRTFPKTDTAGIEFKWAELKTAL